MTDDKLCCVLVIYSCITEIFFTRLFAECLFMFVSCGTLLIRITDVYTVTISSGNLGKLENSKVVWEMLGKMQEVREKSGTFSLWEICVVGKNLS